MCLNIQIDFYYEETQIQSIICDLNSEMKNSEESKVDYYEEKSEDLNQQKIELDRESSNTKYKHMIGIVSFNWMKLNIINII